MFWLCLWVSSDEVKNDLERSEGSLEDLKVHIEIQLFLILCASFVLLPNPQPRIFGCVPSLFRILCKYGAKQIVRFEWRQPAVWLAVSVTTGSFLSYELCKRKKGT